MPVPTRTWSRWLIVLTAVGAPFLLWWSLQLWWSLRPERSTDPPVTTLTSQRNERANPTSSRTSRELLDSRAEAPRSEATRERPSNGETFPKLSSESLERFLDDLLALDRGGDRAGLEEAIEAALGAWGDDPSLPDRALSRVLAATLDDERTLALTAFLRSWLAVAGARGECNPEGAQRFVHGLLAKAFDGERPTWRKLLLDILSEANEAAPGHQLVGLPALGDLLLAHLPEDGNGRQDALTLLGQWSQRGGPEGERFLRGLLTRPGDDLHGIAFQGLLTIASVEGRSNVLAELAASSPRVIEDLTSWMAQRPHLVEAEGLLDWLGSIDPTRFPHEAAARAGLSMLPNHPEGGRLAERLYRDWSTRSEDPRAESMRLLVLRSAFLVHEPDARWRDLLYEAALDHDAEIASHALLVLGTHFPDLAAGRLMDLASAPDTRSRLIAIDSASNTLRSARPDSPLIDPMLALLDDERIPLEERADLASTLMRFREEAITAWRARHGF